jgi:hypothetical protein
MQRRLERAKTLMRRTNQPLAWIAQEAGFADQSHFTIAFPLDLADDEVLPRPGATRLPNQLALSSHSLLGDWALPE